MLECTEVLNHQRNQIFTNVPEEFQPSAVSRMETPRETLGAVFQTLGISDPFHYIKMPQRFGIVTRMRLWSVVV